MSNTCSTCVFYLNTECHFSPPASSHGDRNNWARVDPTDWCGHWSVDGVGVLGGTAGLNAPQWTFGTAAPTGGNDGDWYIQILIALPGPILATSILQKIGGNWTGVTRLQQV
jgi:hypothetical protein